MNNAAQLTHLSQSDIALQIESLVRLSSTVTRQHSGPRTNGQAMSGSNGPELSHHFTHVQQMCNLFDDRVAYDYSEHLLAFGKPVTTLAFSAHPMVLSA